MTLRDYPLSKLLQNRSIFAIFDEEFQKDTWLDVTALLSSDCTINQLYIDGSVPKSTLDRICARLPVIGVTK